MPANLMSFPFRVEPSGVVATVEQGSDQYVEEQLAVAMLTTPGERIQVPTFGCDDPAFRGFEVGNLTRHLADFGPEVTIVEVGRRKRSDDTESLTINWTRRGDETT